MAAPRITMGTHSKTRAFFEGLGNSKEYYDFASLAKAGTLKGIEESALTGIVRKFAWAQVNRTLVEITGRDLSSTANRLGVNPEYHLVVNALERSLDEYYDHK